jgi:hypothetical protein
MTSLQKYENLFRDVNGAIDSFNVLLAKEFKIEPVNASNPESCGDIDKDWPSQQVLPGVYIVCGYHQKDANRLSAYIGKS